MAQEGEGCSPPGDGGLGAVLALNVQHSLDAGAAAYLEKQGRLADLQSQNLIEQNAFELSHLR